MQQVDVGLGKRGYPILIAEGGLAGIGKDLGQRRVGNRYTIVADSQVAELYGQQLLASLAATGLTANLITFPAGEANKNLATIADLASQLARRGTDRKDALIALGGGVTGDITGFLAAIYMRGIPFVQVPTTLLAQVDSSVGGKTGVDLPEGKNLLGVFYQPACVHIDTEVLATLPPAELLNGIAEVIKYGVIYDADFFAFLRQNRPAILGLDPVVLATVIHRCCEIKAAVVAADERESDFRRILNFGHTIGHAVEAASEFAIGHGQAVAMGMVAVMKLAVAKGIFAREAADEVRQLIVDFGLAPVIPAGLDRQAIKSFLSTDKKAIGGRPFFVLPERIGTVLITDAIEEALIDQVIA